MTGPAHPAEDRRFMAAALRLARHHLGRTGTNPSVGCLIVADGVIVGRGVTARGGRPHAETIALIDAGEKARGATAYVTLEPCSHVGHTPPCADALVAAGIARLVWCLTDPDARVSGRGLARLAEAGIAVDGPVLDREGERLLAGYLSRQRRGRPHVTLKLAVSADGGLGRLGAGQVAITGRQARAQSHILRAESDAILIGSRTALADDPELTCRLPGLEDCSPAAFVLDSSLALAPESRLCAACSGPHGRPLTLVCDEAAEATRAAALDKAGARIWPMGTADLGGLLARMGGEGVASLIVEGGAVAADRFLADGLVDRIILFSSGVSIGADKVASPVTRATIPAGFALAETHQFGPDLCETYERTT